MNYLMQLNKETKYLLQEDKDSMMIDDDAQTRNHLSSFKIKGSMGLRSQFKMKVLI